jgi:hypothetical protein
VVIAEESHESDAKPHHAKDKDQQEVTEERTRGVVRGRTEAKRKQSERGRGEGEQALGNERRDLRSAPSLMTMMTRTPEDLCNERYLKRFNEPGIEDKLNAHFAAKNAVFVCPFRHTIHTNTQRMEAQSSLFQTQEK